MDSLDPRGRAPAPASEIADGCALPVAARQRLRSRLHFGRRSCARRGSGVRPGPANSRQRHRLRVPRRPAAPRFPSPPTSSTCAHLPFAPISFSHLSSRPSAYHPTIPPAVGTRPPVHQGTLPRIPSRPWALPRDMCPWPNAVVARSPPHQYPARVGSAVQGWSRLRSVLLPFQFAILRAPARAVRVSCGPRRATECSPRGTRILDARRLLRVFGLRNRVLGTRRLCACWGGGTGSSDAPDLPFARAWSPVTQQSSQRGTAGKAVIR